MSTESAKATEAAVAKKDSGFSPVPVTLLSGFLGSGKTTLLKSILEQKGSSMEVAVLVNDMAELNIDAALVKKENVLQTEEKIVEMQNGCICCTLREDLLLELTKLALMPGKKFDAIVIESTGVSEPQQVAETFTFDISLDAPDDSMKDKEGYELNPLYTELQKASEALGHEPKTLNELAKLDTCVTVIDCKAFSGDLTTCAMLMERYKDMDENDDRNISHLLIDQIEFADVILLNKCDLVTPKEAAAVEKAIKALNPGAKVHKTTKSKVPLEAVMKTGMFDMDKASTSQGWLKSLREEMVPETEEYGIGSFVYRARAPFHPKRFDAFVNSILMVVVNDYEEEEEDEEEEEEEEEEGDQEQPGPSKPKRAKMDEEDSKNGANGKEKNGGNDEEEEEDADEDDDDDMDVSMGEFKNLKERNEACAKRLEHMKSKFGTIYRSKGFIWLAGRDMQFGDWSQSGAVATLEYGGLWVGLMPEEHWPEKNTDAYKKDFAEGGELLDRRQEIVIIGSDLDKEALTAALDDCLLKEEENPDKKQWKLGYEPLEDDPLPQWPDAAKEMEAANAEPDHDHDDNGHHHNHKH